MKELFVILIGAMFIENFVLSKFLGICPFLGVSQKTSTALGMSGAVVFVMTLSSAATYLVNDLLLKPNDLEYLQTIAFILVIAALVQFVEIVLKKLVPPLYKALGIYLPLITTNCAVLGSALINVDPERNYSLLEAIFFGFSAGLGFTMALILFFGDQGKTGNLRHSGILQGHAHSIDRRIPGFSGLCGFCGIGDSVGRRYR